MVLYSTFLGGLISFTVSVKGGAGGPFGKQNTGRSESFAQLVAFLDGCWLFLRGYGSKAVQIAIFAAHEGHASYSDSLWRGIGFVGVI
jgi:hypothetical protein